MKFAVCHVILLQTIVYAGFRRGTAFPILNVRLEIKAKYSIAFCRLQG